MLSMLDGGELKGEAISLMEKVCKLLNLIRLLSNNKRVIEVFMADLKQHDFQFFMTFSF